MLAAPQSDKDAVLRLVGAIVITCQEAERSLKIALPFVASDDPSLGAALARLEKLKKRTLGELAGKLVASSSSNCPEFSGYVKGLVTVRNQVVHHFNETYGSQVSAGAHRQVVAALQAQLSGMEDFRALAEQLALLVAEALRDYTFVDTPEYEQMASLCASFRHRVTGWRS